MSGKDNVIADALSYVTKVKIPSIVDFPVIRETYKDDAVVQSLRTNSKYTFIDIVSVQRLVYTAKLKKETKV